MGPQETVNLIVGAIGLLGALAGSIIGALVSGAVTRKVVQESWNQERNEKDRIGGFSVQMALIDIFSSTVHVLRHLEEARALHARQTAAHKPPGPRPHICMCLEPITNLLPAVTLTRDELYAVSRIGGNDLVGQVAALDRRAAAIGEALQVYLERRQELLAGLDRRHEAGTRVSINLDGDGYAKIRPDLELLDRLATDIHRDARSLHDDPKRTIRAARRAEPEVRLVAADRVQQRGFGISSRPGLRRQAIKGPVASGP